MRPLLFCVLTIFASLATPPALAQEIEVLPGVEVTGSHDQLGRIVAPVFINDEGPFHFIVDTGANRSALSRRIADRLQLAPAAPGVVHAYTGAVEAQFAQVGSLRTEGVTQSALSLPVIETSMLADADGILGVDALAGRRLTLDMRTRGLRIDDGVSQQSGPHWIMLPAQMRFGNLIVAPGRVGRARVNVIVDTGANTSIVNLALRNLLMTRRANARPITGTRIVSMANPVVLDEAVFIPRLELDEGGILNITAYAGDLYIFRLWGLEDEPTIVLGMDVLSRLEAIALNYRRSRVELLVTRSPAPNIVRRADHCDRLMQCP